MLTDSDWFDSARFGMFVHWGAYAVAARGEWVRNRERIPQKEYISRYVDNFRAEYYDPASWAKLAIDAGMKYVVLTTRHHDGFCLWDTKTTGFNSMCYGPQRDLIRPFADAIRDAGLKVGFYYSYADWHHPDYPDAYARDWPEQFHTEEAKIRFDLFYQMQLEELMTHYGKIDMLWYDGCKLSTTGAQANAMVKSLQPGIQINERNGQPYDFKVSEQAIKPAPGGTKWEATLTLNDNWGYHAGDQSFKSAKDVIRLLLQTSGSAGNLLLNVGPKADGTVPEESASILREVGNWLETNGEFLPNSTRSPFSWNNSSTLTTKGNRVYVHLFHSPGTEFCIAEIANKVLSAKWLSTGEPVEFRQSREHLILSNLPVPLPDPLVSTILLEIDGEPTVITKQVDFWIPG